MKKEIKNISGIKINDSITMSVKNKRKNLRELEMLVIALCGYAGIIMFFLGTFTLNFDSQSIAVFSVVFALLYGAAAALRGKTALIFPVSLGVMIIGVFGCYQRLKTGFCLVFNIMYKKLTDTGINYFKSVNPVGSESNITLFLIFALWLLAFIIFFFTIYRPNVLIIVAATFPIIEICLYYGIEVPVIWTSLIIGYWFAVLSICSSDLGEYFGGGSGFTRKDDVFFPKRRMKFKVTEKCGLSIIAISLAAAVVTSSIIDLSGYQRSEKIKNQRRELKTAINSFSMEDLASSVSDITEALGFSFEYQDNRLGKFNKITYKGQTDLVVTLDEKPSGAVYLKGFTAAGYDKNEWFELSSEKYNDINSMFEKYNVYPQQILYNLNSSDPIRKIKIVSKKKSRKFYVPYGTAPDDSFSFVNDNSIKHDKSKDYTFEFIDLDIQNTAGNINLKDVDIYIDFYDFFTDEQKKTIADFCDEYQNNRKLNNIENLPVLTDYNYMMTMLVENQYRNFVYDNYLSYPNNEDFKEIYKAYSDILDNASVSTAAEKLDTLQKIKDKINSEVEYTLEPGKTPSTRDFVNYFLLENKKGYCVHYATAGVMLARMAGIPARYATGYVSVGDDYNDDSKNPDGSYTIELADNRSHAWAEVYIDGLGWIPFEFTAGYSNSSIAFENPETTAAEPATTASSAETTSPAVSASSVSTVSSSITKNSSYSKSNITSAVKVTSVTSKTDVTSNSDNLFSTILYNSRIKKIFIVIAVLLLIFLRRWIIIFVRNKKLNSGKAKKRVMNNYKYVTKLLNYMGIKQKNLQYSEFSDLVEYKLADTYFEKDCFCTFSNIVLKYAFGNPEPQKDELEFVSAFSKELSGNIYKNSNVFIKIYLKLFSVLV